MKIFKRICFCFVLILVCVFFAGCSTINFSTCLKENGSIVQNIEIDLSELQSSKGLNAMMKVKNIIKTYYNQLDEAYQDNVIVKYSQIYDFEALGITTNSAKMFYIVTKNPTFDLDLGFNSGLNDANTIVSISKTFVNIYSYLMYFYPDVFVADLEKGKLTISSEYRSLIDIPFNSDFQEQQNWFVTTCTQICYPFYYNGDKPKILKDCTINFNNYVKGKELTNIIEDEVGLSENEVELLFNFSTPYARIHSNGEVSLSSGNITHTWKLNDINTPVFFWRNYANYLAWYILALCIGVVFIIASIIVIAISKKSKKKKGLSLLKKIDDFQNKK